MKIDRRIFLGSVAAGLTGATSVRAELPARPTHPGLANALAKISARAWAPLAQDITQLAPQSALVLVNSLAKAVPIGLDTGDLAQQAMGHTILAAFALDWAWRYRGTGVGSTVTPEGLRGFGTQLALAREHITQAIARDGDDGAAHALGFRVDMGLSDTAALATGFRPYAMAARRPVAGLSSYGTAISAKWLGSEEACITFARQVHALDVPASCGILPNMHFISVQSRVMAHLSPDTLEAEAGYFHDPSVRSDIESANEMFWASAPDPDPYANWYANGWFAYALLLQNDAPGARRHVLAMGNEITGPWADLPNPRAAFGAVRRALGLEAL